MEEHEQRQDAWQQDPLLEDLNDYFLNTELTYDFNTFDLSPAQDTSTFTFADLENLEAALPRDTDLSTPNVCMAASVTPAPSNTLNLEALEQLMHQEASAAHHRRSLPRRRSRYTLSKPGSCASPMAIPSRNGSPRQSLAMQRWQNSPPEDEAASLSAIYTAMDRRSLNGPAQGSRTRSYDGLRTHRGPSSTTSVESAASESSIHSINSNHSTVSRRRSRVTKPREASKGKGKKTMTGGDRKFPCTFCCDTFKHKFDWSRHEKSLHLNLEEWLCAPYGGAVLSSSTGRVHCAYCNALDPTHEHLEQHAHSACACQGAASTPRTFRRKDHLVQHLRLVHGLETLPLIEDWKVVAPAVVSRCGFCDLNMKTWEERTDHLAAHFREGKTMKDWRGEHGFEPEVMARVTYAYPPYLIAFQSETLVPFSATNKDSIEHTQELLRQIELADMKGSLQNGEDGTDRERYTSPPDKAYTKDSETRVLDILTRHLSRFAREQMMKGVIPSDEMFQRESRRVLYQDEDEWNQTVADDPRWIQDFKRREGFD